MKKIILAFIALALSISANAQLVSGSSMLYLANEKPETSGHFEHSVQLMAGAMGEFDDKDGFYWDDGLGSLSYIAGWRFNDSFFLGGEVGIADYYDIGIDILANAKLNLSKAAWAPFVSVAGGVFLWDFEDIYPQARIVIGVSNPASGFSVGIGGGTDLDVLGLGVSVGYTF